MNGLMGHMTIPTEGIRLRINICKFGYRYFFCGLPALLICLICSFFLENVSIDILDLLVLTAVYMCVISVFLAVKNGYKNNLSFIIFVFSFFTLCVGSYALNIHNSNYYGKLVFHSTCSISYANEAKGLICMVISLFFIGIGYFFRIKNNTINIIEETPHINHIVVISKGIMIFGMIFAAIKMGSNIFRFVVFGYRSTYTGVTILSGAFATIVDIFDGLYLIGFISYLATLPDIKRARLHIAFYILYSCSFLLIGSRGGFVTYILFLLWYFGKIDNLKDGKKILTKSRIFIILIVSFFLIAFLYNYQYIRNGISVKSTSVLDSFRSFFESQGLSGRLTALGLEYENEVKRYVSPFMIFFSPIILYVKRNAVFRIIFGSYAGQSLENLQRYPNFSWAITYATNPSSFLSGGGLGSNYIAETVLSGGVLLLVIYSVVVGVILSCIDGVKIGNWKSNYLLMTIFYYIIYIPRATALGVIPALVLPVIVMYIIKWLANSKRITSNW